jgi:hypothetical protein
VLNSFRDESEIAVAKVAGKVAAAGLLLHGEEFSEVPWASSDRNFNRIGINMFMYSELLRRSIEIGAKAFDFGRSTVNAGTYKFKKQWGASPIPLHWSYWLEKNQDLPDLSPENTKYALAIKAWSRLPVPVSNLIGPFLARNLP